MLNHTERHKSILLLLEKEEFISVQSLSDKLKVSLVTVRKDLNILEKKGYLYRTHGGASKKSRYAFEQNIIEKEEINVEKKQKIAKKALSHIKESDIILLGSGTTIHQLARIISGFNNLTILTSSLLVSTELCKESNINIIQLGGNVRKSSNSVIGSVSEKNLKQFSCNKLFLGIDGIDVNFGISTSNVGTAHLNRIMIERADKLFVLADSSKINKRGFGKICELDKIDVLITDNNIKQKDLLNFENAGIIVEIAD